MRGKVKIMRKISLTNLLEKELCKFLDQNRSVSKPKLLFVASLAVRPLCKPTIEPLSRKFQ